MSKHPKSLREFIYVDHALLDKYLEQIRETFSEVPKKTYKISASLAGPAVEASQTKEKVTLKTHEKIELLEAFIQEFGNHLTARPSVVPFPYKSDGPRFVSESMRATKVMIPVSGEIKGVSSAAIWVSDPDPTLFVHEPYEWRGTFLYLSEIHWDNGRDSQFYSGVSALQALINLSKRLDFLRMIENEFEPYGRGRDLHPIDKLKEIGGIATDVRSIKALYRIRYFTNEQLYSYNGEQRRVNDLLGYPIYISEEA
jgi:hypothetical protein